MEQLKDFLTKHKWAILLTIIGVLYVLLCLELGFWKTILLTIVAAFCCYIGISIDKKNKNNMDE